MDRVFSVKPQPLITAIADALKQNEKIVLPKDYDIIKTGHGKCNTPCDLDWFYTRMAAIVRSIMIKGRVSHRGLASKFSCRKNVGVRPSKFSRASDFVNHAALEQLKSIGWIDFGLGKNIFTDSAKEVLNEIIEKVIE